MLCDLINVESIKNWFRLVWYVQSVKLNSVLKFWNFYFKNSHSFFGELLQYIIILTLLYYNAWFAHLYKIQMSLKIMYYSIPGHIFPLKINIKTFLFVVLQKSKRFTIGFSRNYNLLLNICAGCRHSRLQKYYRSIQRWAPCRLFTWLMVWNFSSLPSIH